MRKIDIRKIYICEIRKLKDIKLLAIDEKILTYVNGIPVFDHDASFALDFDKKRKFLGLFIKNINGYTHILTGKKYKLPKANLECIGKLVINPFKIEKLTNKENLSYNLINKYQSYKISIEDIEALEKRISHKNNSIKKYDEKIY